MNMDKYAVIGNPVSHSLSPKIHALFAEETGQQLEYRALQFDEDLFDDQLQKLIRTAYRGVNVTVPFKQKAYAAAHRLSPRAEDAGAVNTLIFEAENKIAGDNTDGIGLTRDLVINHRILIQNRRILVLGAGGAVRGVMGPLLAQKPRHLVIANRTLEKAQQLVQRFTSHENTELTSSSFDDLSNLGFDLIINGTSAGLKHEVPPLPDDLLGVNTICYDMMYDVHKDTAFVEWALQRGALRAFDGLGMLVEQAAESFYIWRGVRPSTQPVIEKLRQQEQA